MKRLTPNLLFYITLLFFCSFPTHTQAQTDREFELEGNTMSTHVGEGITFGLAGKFIHWLNPYVGATIGVATNYSRIDEGFYSPKDSQIYYDLEDKVFNLNGSLGLRLSTPVYKRIGMSTDFNFVFDPIPFDVVSIERRTYEPNSYGHDEKDKTQFVFSRFNPSYRIDLSFFYEKETKVGRARLSLGGAITNLNPYNGYYRAKVDGLRLKDHVKLRSNDLNYVIFIRLSGDY